MKVFIVAQLCLIACVLAAPGITDNRVESIEGYDSKITKLFGNCLESSDILSCLTVRGITALNRATRSNKIEIAPGVIFTRDQSVPFSREGKSISESDVASSLPKDPEEKTEKLVDLAMDSVTDFLKSHELQVKISPEDTKEIARSFEEGRGKMKKMMGPLIMALGAKLVALVPILLGGLALLATKALIVAKIAFLLAVSLSATKLLGGGSSVLGKIAGGAGSSGWSGNTAGWSAGNQGWSSGSYPYARSLDAHDIAYNGQVPSEQEE